MVRLLAFLKAKPGISLSDFRAYYENRHVPLIRSIVADIAEYRRHYLEGDALRAVPGAARPNFDAVAELVFADEASFHAGLQALAAASTAIREDERRFLLEETICVFRVVTRS